MLIFHAVFAKNAKVAEVGTDPECRSRLRKNSAIFLRTRSQKIC